MANYTCTIRTNYFHVKDETKFRHLMEHSHGIEDDISVFEEKDESGRTVFGFGLYGLISGFLKSDTSEETDTPNYNKFIKKLQKCVTSDDAIIIFEAGNEKLNYVEGIVTVITSSKIKTFSMEDIAIKKVKKMLNNSSWETMCRY